MNLRLLFFGALSDHFGAAMAREGLADNLTASALRDLLIAEKPESAGSFAKSMVAVNTEYVDADKCLSDGDEVAFLPPVSGG